MNRLFNNTTHCIILIGQSLIEAMNNIKLNIETQYVRLEEVRFSEEEILLLKDEELLWLKWGNLYGDIFFEIIGSIKGDLKLD